MDREEKGKTATADKMIEIELKNLQDFKRVVDDQKTVYFKKTSHGFVYYVVSTRCGVGIINIFKSEHSLKFNEEFNPEELDGINVESLIEIESISHLRKRFS